MAKFYNIPPDVQVFVTTRDVAAGTTRASADRRYLKAVLVPDSDANGGGGSEPKPGAVPAGTGGATDGVPIARLQTSGGSAFAVWEWVSNDPASSFTLEDVSFSVVLAVKPGASLSGVLNVSGSFAPLSTATFSDFDAPVPRFVQTGQPLPAFSFRS